MTEFEFMYGVQHTNSWNSCNDLNSSLLQASRQGRTTLCRRLIGRLIETTDVTEDNNMEKALDIAFEKLDKHTVKAVSWGITKIFYAQFQEYLIDASDVYPGIRCVCLDKHVNAVRSPLCSAEKVIIIITSRNLSTIPPTFKGFYIQIFNPFDAWSSSSEAHVLTDKLLNMDSSYLSIQIPSTNAENLFNKHTSVTFICPSVLRSLLFHKFHVVKNEVCVRLYCKKKGIIPIGEDHFPLTINGIATDIVEGCPVMISNLRIGDKIGTLASCGTLGGFVKYLDFDCFLTCAHVMYDLQTLLASSEEFAKLTGADAYLYRQNNQTICGKVIFRAFDHSVPMKTSIDAALVLLQNNFTINPIDYILDQHGMPRDFTSLGMSSGYLNFNCLDHEDICIGRQVVLTVGAGACTKVEQMVTFDKQCDVDVNFSSIGSAAVSMNTGIFTPLWIHSPAHVQLSIGNVSGQRIFRMYNQIAVALPLKSGDSGTCIYVVKHATHNGCIGMAIAFCGGLAVITPLKDILKRINAI